MPLSPFGLKESFLFIIPHVARALSVTGIDVFHRFLFCENIVIVPAGSTHGIIAIGTITVSDGEKIRADTDRDISMPELLSPTLQTKFGITVPVHKLPCSFGVNGFLFSEHNGIRHEEFALRISSWVAQIRLATFLK